MIDYTRKNFSRLRSSLSQNFKLTISLFIRLTLKPFCNLIDKTIYFFLPKDKKVITSSKIALIVSTPRSGSTFLYQTLTKTLNTIYFSNFHQLFPRLGSKFIFSKRICKKNFTTLKNFYGHTTGLRDVNEGNELIKYWFKSTDPRGIRARFLETIEWVQNGKNIPVIIKNVGIYDRIYDLYHAVPELIIINISRNTSQAVESYLKAYYELGYFNLIPNTIKNKPIIDPVELSVDIFLKIQNVLNNNLDKIPNKNIINLPYEDFCKNPNFYIQLIATKLQLSRDINLLNNIKIKASQSQKVSYRDSKKIKSYLSKIKSKAR
jgi:hypothetical protein